MSGTKIITNPNGAFGYTADTGGTVQEMLTSTSVAEKAVVALSTTNTLKVAAAATDSTASLSLGIAIAAATGSQTIPVVTRGLVRSVPVAGAVAQGDILKRSVTTAGSLSATASPATGEAFAVALAASASNVADVWVIK